MPCRGFELTPQFPITFSGVKNERGGSDTRFFFVVGGGQSSYASPEESEETSNLTSSSLSKGVASYC
jgi:hypothetical protein